MSDIENTTQENENNHTPTRVGDRLKDIRETKGYSLKYISQQTKISVRILENIEESNFGELPNKTYVAGFLKSYCRILNLNSNDYLDDFIAEIDSAKNTPTKAPVREQEGEEYQSVSQKQVMAILGLLVIVGVFLAMFKFISAPTEQDERVADVPNDVVLESISANTPLATEDEQVDSEQNEETLEPSETSEASEELATDAEEIVDTTDSQSNEATETTDGETLEENSNQDDQVNMSVESETTESTNEKPEDKVVEEAQVVEEKKEEQKEEPKKKEEPKEKEEVEFTDLTLPLYQFDTVDIDDIPADHLPLTYRQSIINGKQNVFINATDGDTWITYKSDDDKVKKFILKQGRRLLIRGDLIRLFMGNVKVTKMFLNNRPLIIETKSGVRSLVFPQERSSEFKIPLFIYKKDGTVQPSDEYIAEQE